jgi:RNA polymerase sigma factor (sigma-70 family)
MPTDDLLSLIEQARAGDQAAWQQLMDLYYPQIRAYIGNQMDQQLRKVLDSTDIVQSVVTNFWLRLIAGEFDFTNEASVLGLLMTIAKGKLIDNWRAFHATDKRDLKKEIEGLDMHAIGTGDSTPSMLFAEKELVGRLYEMMSEEEQVIFKLRIAGSTWADIGKELDKSADAVRKQYERAIERIIAELALETNSQWPVPRS